MSLTKKFFFSSLAATCHRGNGRLKGRWPLSSVGSFFFIHHCLWRSENLPISRKPGDENGWDIATGGSFAGGGSDDLDWDHKSMWSTGLSKEHFDGVSVGRQNNNAAANPPSSDSSSGDVMSKLGPREAAMVNEMNEYDDMIKEIEKENRHSRGFVGGIKQKMMEMSVLLKQVKEPGARGSYLKDSEKTEMYRLHTENPEVYIVERLAKDFRIMRQRVHAILFLKEDEEEEERKLGRPLDDSVERLLDEYPE
ncbi:mucin-related [Raphanus sativus]|nr:mucin-related [Raphanus sativus]